MPKHAAPYSGESRGKDHKARAVYAFHGYTPGTFRPGRTYGKHSTSEQTA